MEKSDNKIFHLGMFTIVINAVVASIACLLVFLLVPMLEHRVLVMFLIAIVSSVLMFTVSYIFTRRCLKSTVREDNSIK